MKMKTKEKGVVQMLCEEIGATYTEQMESTAVLVEFIAVLVDEIDEMMAIQKHLVKVTGKDISVGATESLACVKNLVKIEYREKIIEVCSVAHRVTYVPDEGPCDHYIDMLSSCVSAIRFGLEVPCHSRHAAEAASHIWRHKYGITLSDKYSSGWGKEWARSKFYEALGRLSNIGLGK